MFLPIFTQKTLKSFKEVQRNRMEPEVQQILLSYHRKRTKTFKIGHEKKSQVTKEIIFK